MTGRDQDNSTVLLRRDLRGSRVEISPADPTPRARGSCAPDSQTNERHSGGYHGVDSRGDMKSYSKQTRGSFSKQTEGTLPFPSRRNSSDNFVAASYDSERWANPAPPGRPRSTLDNSALSLSHAGFVDSRSGGRGSGGKGSAGRIGRSARAGNNGMNSKVASAHQPHASQRGSKPREGGVLSYRSGSPAPARGRRKGNASHISNSSPISRLSREQKVHEPPRHLQGSKIPPEVKGHIASTRRGVWVGGGDWGAGDSHGLSAPSRQNMPSTTTSRDRRRRERDDLQWEDARSALISNVRAGTPRQRPSTSEGLQNDGSEMRRRRSPTPAPRPSSGESLLVGVIFSVFLYAFSFFVASHPEHMGVRIHSELILEMKSKYETFSSPSDRKVMDIGNLIQYLDSMKITVYSKATESCSFGESWNPSFENI